MCHQSMATPKSSLHTNYSNNCSNLIVARNNQIIQNHSSSDLTSATIESELMAANSSNSAKNIGGNSRWGYPHGVPTVPVGAQSVVAAQPRVGVSASVGHDHWANDVLNAVSSGVPGGASVNSAGGTTGSGLGSGSNSPGSTSSGGCGEARSPTNTVSSYETEDNFNSGTHQTLAHNEVGTITLAENVRRKVLERKRKFHTGRPLELKNLPEGCTEQDIHGSFPDLGIVSIVIETNDGRYKAGAKLSVENPEVLDDWPESRRNVFVKNKEVSVCVGNSDGWLCVAKLPLSYSEEDFVHLAGLYGKVREAFLMISEKTGDSKGYGLIKYVSSDAAAQARHLLDGRTVTCPKFPHMSYSLNCDWLSSSHITFKSLHSKALLVERLPPGYRDLKEFRNICSVVQKPAFSNFGMTKGVIQDWGLVEFFDSNDTELTQVELQDYKIFKDGLSYSIRVHFCIPGVNAIHLHMKALNAPPDPKKKALLNDQPTANVYSQLQKLESQNPGFAQNVQSIIQVAIQTLSTGQPSTVSAEKASSASSSSTSKPTTVEQTANSASSSNCPTSSSTACVTVNTYPQTILSTAPQQNQPNVQPTTNIHASQSQQATADQQVKSTISPTLNTNAQAALAILLTAQMQSQTGETSILQNPQVVGILQNLVSQAGNPDSNKNSVNADSGNNNLNEILNHPALSNVIGSTLNNPAMGVQQPMTWPTSTNGGNAQSNGEVGNSMILNQSQGLVMNAQQQASIAQRTALLDTPKRPSLLGQAPVGINGHSQQAQTISSLSSSHAPTAPVMSNSEENSTTPSILTNNLNNLLNAQNLSQLLGSITGDSNVKAANSSTPEHGSSQQTTPSGQQQRPVLLSNPPPQNINVSQSSGIPNGILMGYPTALPNQHQQSQSQGHSQNNQPVAMANPTVQLNQFAQSTPSMLTNMSLQQPSITTQSFSMSNNIGNQQPPNNYLAVVPSPSATASQNPFLLNAGYNMAVPPPVSSVSQLGAPPAFVYGAPPIQAFGPSVGSSALPGAQSLCGSYVQANNVSVQPSSAQMSFGSAPIGTPANMMAAYGAQQALALSSFGIQSPNVPNSIIPQQNSMVSQYPTTPVQQQMQSPSFNGCGVKRKLPIPPSPENSPDGPFIGQHSQGIGGHYADSYWRNRSSQNLNKRQRF